MIKHDVAKPPDN